MSSRENYMNFKAVKRDWGYDLFIEANGNKMLVANKLENLQAARDFIDTWTLSYVK